MYLIVRIYCLENEYYLFFFFFFFKTTNCILKDIFKSSLSCNAHTCMCGKHGFLQETPNSRLKHEAFHFI